MIWALAIGITVAAIAGILVYGTRMPERSFQGIPPPLTSDEIVLCDRLRRHVHVLATEIGERNRLCYEALERARIYIGEQFSRSGLETRDLPYRFQGETFYNVEVLLEGSEPSLPGVVVGAHYDSVVGSPGANDNATGVAALLELARLLAPHKPARTLRLVAFANEEPPYFNTGEGMGSIEYVRSFPDPHATFFCMISLETIGQYSDQRNSQDYPPLVGLFYPDRGDFIAFVGNLRSRNLVRRAVGTFRLGASVPSQGAALPSLIPGVSLSDHRSFWEAGSPPSW
ncbi:MAG TPA: M28 family peptidase [Syntrophobacteraceae bacterium]|nr:M28 family peptidase [Syntrophobacteraceae bacterium]